MAIIIFPDMHLNDPFCDIDRAGRFTNLFQNDKMLSVGDTYGYDSDPYFKKDRKNIYSRIEEIDKIAGNHDIDMTIAFDKFFPSFEFTVNGKKVKVIHGDEEDKTLNNKFFYICGIIIKYLTYLLFGFNVKGWLRKANAWLGKVLLKKDELIPIFTNLRLRLIEKYKGQCDILIIGHTHMNKIVEKNGMFLYDIGCFIKKFESYYIRIENDKLEYQEFK